MSRILLKRKSKDIFDIKSSSLFNVFLLKKMGFLLILPHTRENIEGKSLGG
jgi:hypothetical protein